MSAQRPAKPSETLVLAGLAFTALFACKQLANKADPGSTSSPSPAPVAARGPIALNWDQPYKLKVAGSPGQATFFATREADKPPLKLNASFLSFPKGTKIELGSDQTTVGDSGFWATLVDIKPAVLKSSLDDLKAPIDVDLELTITVPGAPPATTKLQKQNVKESVRAALLRARDGGVNFGPSDVAIAKPSTVAILSGYSDLDFIGPGKNLSDVDWVVIAEDQKDPRATKSCTFKDGPSTLKMFDANAVAVDRRTGQKLAEQVLKAGEECPMIALINKPDNSVKNSVAQKDVAAWARAELAKGGTAGAKAPPPAAPEPQSESGTIVQQRAAP